MVFKRLFLIVYTGISYFPLTGQNVSRDTSSIVTATFPVNQFKEVNIAAGKVVSQGKSLLDTFLRPGKELIRDLSEKVNIFKGQPAGVRLTNLYLNTNVDYIRDTTGIATGSFQSVQYIYSINAGTTLTFASLPFDFRFSGNNGQYTFYNTPLNRYTKFNFNHRQYLDKVQKLVSEKIDPEKILNTVLSRINKVKTQYENSLKQEIQKIQQEYQAEFNQVLQIPGSITDISVNDLASLQSRLIPEEVLREYQLSQQQLPGANPLLQEQAGTAPEKTKILAGVKKMEALEKIYKRIVEWKSKFDGNPVVKELRSHLPFTASSFGGYLKKPSSLVDIVKQQASLSSLQRLFLNITRLDIGSNPLSGGELNFRDIINNGVNTEFTSNKSSFGLTQGNGYNNINPWLQAGLNSFVSSEYSRMTGMKMGTGWNSSMKGALSINLYDFRISPEFGMMDPGMLSTNYLSAPARRDAVITWRSAFDLSNNQKISIGISKSFGGYRNSASGDSSAQKENVFGDIFSSRGTSNYAASVDYKGNLLKTDIQVVLKKAGLGYSNPGDMLVRKGEDRAGLSVSRKLFKQKLTVRYKADYRFQRLDPDKFYTYSSFANNLQANYKINRYNKVSLSYRQNRYSFKKGTASQDHGNNYSIQADASYLFKLNGKKINNYFSISGQQFDIPLLTGGNYSSKTWSLSQISTLQLKKDIITLNLLMNKSDNKDYYFNTSQFNGEICYSYSLGDKIRLSTGAGYISNTGWNTQLGFRQQISGTVMKKMDFDIDLNFKKALKIIRPELANQVFISSSLNYRF